MAKVEGKMCNGKPIISEWVVMELTPHWYGLLDDLNFTKIFRKVSGKEKFKSLECGDNLILDGTITIEIDPSNLTYNKTWL